MNLSQDVMSLNLKTIQSPNTTNESSSLSEMGLIRSLCLLPVNGRPEALGGSGGFDLRNSYCVGG